MKVTCCLAFLFFQGLPGVLAQVNCDTANLKVGSASTEPGKRARVELLGQVTCEITGFSIAVGYDAGKATFIEATPSPFLVGHAGADLVFSAFKHHAEGFTAFFMAFDLSNPITVPPVAIPEETHLATLVYEVKAGVAAGTRIDLRNESMVFGSPVTIANVYTVPAGGKEIFPLLESGSIEVIAAPQESPFLRGDSNFDGAIDISDGIFTVFFLFLGSPPPPCEDAADTDDTGAIDLTDVVHGLLYLFLEGDPPPDPGPLVPGPDTPEEDPLRCIP